MTKNVRDFLIILSATVIFLTACSNSGAGSPDGVSSSGTGSTPQQLVSEDFSGASDGTALSVFDYASSQKNGIDAFIIKNGVIELNTEDGWFNFYTSAFDIDRSENGGVKAEWEVRYPDAIAERDRELAKFYFELLDSSDISTYTLLYKPHLTLSETAFNLELKNSTGTLVQTKTYVEDENFTSNGSSAEWISFKLEMKSDGTIIVSINNIEHINTSDASHTKLAKVKFTYRTGADARTYNVQVRNISVLPIE